MLFLNRARTAGVFRKKLNIILGDYCFSDLSWASLHANSGQIWAKNEESSIYLQIMVSRSC